MQVPERRDDIRRNGYAGALKHAREIASSRESEIEVYKRACNQQRLLALYKELLGRDSAQIDQTLWRSQLEHLERGDVEEVVSDITEVLVEWKAAGLCHSDEHMVTGDMVPPPEALAMMGIDSIFPISSYEWSPDAASSSTSRSVPGSVAISRFSCR